MSKFVAALLVAGATGAALPALAAEGGQSPYQKGYTDALAGIVPPYPGLYARSDTLYYTGDVDAAVVGGRISLDLDVESIANVTAFTWVTEQKVLGGQYAFAFALPVAAADITAQVRGPLGNTFSVEDQTAGVGDFFIAPVVLGWHSGKVHTNASIGFYLPAGFYQDGALANLGKNYASTQLQGAGTWLDPESGWAISGAATYLINAENRATNYETGDMFHVDGAVTKAFGGWRLGVVGYAMAQITGDSGAGARLGSFKSSVYGLGPFASYDAKFGERQVTFQLKWYHEFEAKNTFEGDTVGAAFSMKF